jgi:hypothetical protein
MTKPNNTRITPAAANANQRSIFSRNGSDHHHAAVWGDGFLLQMSRDLLAEFPDIKGFSKRNLEQMR